MAKYKFPRLARSTVEVWTRRYQELKELENHSLDILSSHVIRRWIEKKVKYFKSDDYLSLNRGYAKRCNLDNEICLLSHVLNYYKQSETFEEESSTYTNPVRTQEFRKLGFIRPKPIAPPKITPEEVASFLKHLKPVYYELAILQYLTGSRIGEICGLQWSRVDFKRKQLTIMETCSWSGNKTYQGLNPHPKNKTPRVCYLTPLTESCLRSLELLKKDGCDFVFHFDGQPFNYSTVQSNYRGAFRKAGLPFNSKTQCMRHGIATLARKLGGGLDATIAITGHKDLKMADHYSKIDEDSKKDVFQKVSNHMSDIILEQNQPDNVVSFSKKNSRLQDLVVLNGSKK